MAAVKFTCSTLQKLNKKGILPKDADGYISMPVGALGVHNSAGEYYTYEGAKELFESSSAFMRRVNAGVLKGEAGHPKILPGQDMNSYAQRIMTVEETNISHHHSEVWLDFDNVKDANGKPVIAIMSKIKPTGPMGPALEDSLSNPKDNTCFSIRAFTVDYMSAGVNNRVLKQIVTWDWVVESGLAVARKYFAPSLESRNDVSITKEMLASAVNIPKGVGMESTRAMGFETLEALGWSFEGVSAPKWANW